MISVKKIITVIIFSFFLLSGNIYAILPRASKSTPNEGSRYIRINNDTDEYCVFEFDLWTEGYISNFAYRAAAPKFRVILEAKEKKIIDTEIIGNLKNYREERDRINNKRGWDSSSNYWLSLTELLEVDDANTDRSKDNSYYKTGWMKKEGKKCNYSVWALKNSDPLVSLLQTIKTCLLQKIYFSEEERNQLKEAFRNYLFARPSPIAEDFLNADNYDIYAISATQLVKDLKKIVELLKLEYTYIEQDRIKYISFGQYSFPQEIYAHRFYRTDDSAAELIFQGTFSKKTVGRDIEVKNKNHLRYVWEDSLMGWNFIISRKTQMQREEEAQEKINNLLNPKPKDKPKVEYDFSGWDD